MEVKIRKQGRGFAGKKGECIPYGNIGLCKLSISSLSIPLKRFHYIIYCLTDSIPYGCLVTKYSWLFLKFT